MPLPAAIQSKKVVKECEGERVESESVAVAVKVEHSLNITLKDETLIPISFASPGRSSSCRLSYSLDCLVSLFYERGWRIRDD